MILRKPYAFLIKHFRLLHLILLAFIIFNMSVFNDIHSLFNRMHKNSMYMYTGSKNYINNIVFIILIVGFLLAIILYSLLKKKKKPCNEYMFLAINFAVELIVIIYLFSILKTIENETISIDTVIFVKDITLAINVPNIAFVVICFIRGIGFNLKQFNFSKDAEALEIADVDSEEFEFLIGQNNYKHMRKLRRFIREMKYYALENMFSLLTIAGITILIGVGIGIYYYNLYLKRLAEEEANAVGTIVYSVNASYITQYDFAGNLINPNKKYVVVNMTFGNRLEKPQALDLAIITLYDGKNSYQPTMLYNSSFYDMGKPYENGLLINSLSTTTATICFEVPASTKGNNLELRVQYKIDTSILNDVVAEYRKFEINAKKIDAEEVDNKRELKSRIDVNVLGVNDFSITLNNFFFTDSYQNMFVVCKSIRECGTKSNIIAANKGKNQTMLVLEYDGTIYERANFSKTLNTFNKIFEGYLTVEYEKYGKTYKDDISVASGSNVNNKVFINVSRKVATADHVKITFNFRNQKYYFNLV